MFLGRCLLVKGMPLLSKPKSTASFDISVTIVLLVFKPHSYQYLFLKWKQLDKVWNDFLELDHKRPLHYNRLFPNVLSINRSDPPLVNKCLALLLSYFFARIG